MKITNPTKDHIEVSIKGIRYAIEPEGVLENIPEAVAREWQESLHKFLIIKKDKLEEVKVENVEVPAPKVADSEVTFATESTVLTTSDAIPAPEDAIKAPEVDLKNEIKKGKDKKVK